MKIATLAVCVLALFNTAAWAQQPKGCDALKAQIDKKIQANGVQDYTLEVVAAEDVKEDQKVVGTCEGGSKKIVYTRGKAPQ